MAPTIERLPAQPSQPANRSPVYDTARREAAQRVREAQDDQQRKVQDTNEAKAQEAAARERLQMAKAAEQQAAQRLSAAKADQEEAARASRQQPRGGTINVVA